MCLGQEQQLCKMKSLQLWTLLIRWYKEGHIFAVYILFCKMKSLQLWTLLKVIQGESYFLQFIFCFTKKWRMFFSHKYVKCVKLVNKSKYLIRISICLVVLAFWPKICQNESFRHFPCPRKKNTHKKKTTRKWGKNESHHDNSWNSLLFIRFLHVWHC